jgi:MoaA/NifB/PqqE/SkfB family radical SAM enzyme
MHLDPVHFDIVSSCQLLCVGCPSAGLGRRVTMIDPSFFGACLNNIDVDSIGVFRCFNYGEPLLHHRLPDIFSVLNEFRARSMPIQTVEMSTNAQTVNWDHLQTVLRMGVLDRLVVSCDGDGTPASFERLRPPARWPKLIEFLERVSAIKATEQLKLELITRTIVEADSDCERWRAVLAPRGWTPDFRAWKYLPQAPENRTGRVIHAANGVCMFMEHAGQLYVDADGAVVPCCVHPRAAVLGNLGTTRYSAMLNGGERVTFMGALSERRHELPVCGVCEYGPADRPGPSAGNRVLTQPPRP